MSEKELGKIVILGQKETFLIRVLLKKCKENGFEGIYTPSTVDDINKVIHDASVLAYYMESGEHVSPAVIQYLKDTLNEEEKKIILIGDKGDTDSIKKGLRIDQIAKVFSRPLDNDEFFRSVLEQYTEEERKENKKTILVVDDDPTYLGLVRDWIKDHYKVAMANSGLQAIKWLGKNHADLILLDHEMPVTTGPQVLEMLRSEHETASIPVIFLTGKSDKASVMQVVDLKPEGYLLKSRMDRNELLDKLKDFFSKNGKID